MEKHEDCAVCGTGRADSDMDHADQSIRPLPCKGSYIHSSHVWEDKYGNWSCPGKPLDKSYLDAIESSQASDLADDRRRIKDYQDAPLQPSAEYINYGDPVPESVPSDHPPVPGKDRISSHGERDLEVYQQHQKWTHDKPGTEVAKWADTAMYTAEPVATDGPRVYLLWMAPDPLGAIAAACKMYKGEVVRDLATITDTERLDYLAQIQKTKLKAPFEFVKFHFMIEGVTRAFTHQMVRQRTAVYAQESMRFAVKEDMPVGLPPSLAGLPEEDSAVKLWHQSIDDIGTAYKGLVGMGVPAEDARGLLPTNILTRLHYSTDLRALLDHAGNRLCTQAQFEWRLVFAKIVEAIRGLNMDLELGYSPVDANGTTKVYMAKELTEPFKPVCYQTGKCEFNANFDRACSIRERVDANERIGRPSSEWDQTYIDKNVMEITAIKPGEWLLDHTAARRAD